MTSSIQADRHNDRKGHQKALQDLQIDPLRASLIRYVYHRHDSHNLEKIVKSTLSLPTDVRVTAAPILAPFWTRSRSCSTRAKRSGWLPLKMPLSSASSACLRPGRPRPPPRRLAEAEMTQAAGGKAPSICSQTDQSGLQQVRSEKRRNLKKIFFLYIIANSCGKDCLQ